MKLLSLSNRTFTFINLGVILLISLFLRLIHLPKDALGFDEGVNLMAATLVNVGHSAYTATFVSIPPVALLTVQTGALLLGNSVNVRIPMLLYSLIGIAAIYWIVREQVNDYAGLLAAILLSFNGAYFSKSTVILGEVPAIALLSVALVQQYKNRPTHYVWLFLPG